MDQEETGQPLRGEARLAAYLDAIGGVLGHARRAAAARAYCTGLLLPGERKSIEPMAARLDPIHVQAKHQALHHVVAQADWDDAAVLAAVRVQVLPAIEREPQDLRSHGGNDVISHITLREGSSLDCFARRVCGFLI